MRQCSFMVIVLTALFMVTHLTAQNITISPGEAPVPVVTPNVRIEFPTVSDKYYMIESSQDLVRWKPEGYAFMGNGRRMSALVSNHGLPRLFYRIRNNATESETAPVIPYAAVASTTSGSTTATPITADQVDPTNDRLVLMCGGSSTGTMRSIALSELRNIPGFAARWGEIQGSLSTQTDLMSALNSKYSSGNPPAWAAITDKPSSLSGYGIIDAISKSSVGFMDRFSRYAQGTVLVNNVTLPEVGRAWRFNTTGKSRLDVSTLSVVSADSSFRDSANGFVANYTTPGDIYVTSGFTNPANNGRFRVTSVEAGRITVTSDTGAPVNLVDEPAGPGRRYVGAYPPYIANNALRAADKSLIYIGAPTTTRNGRFTISFEVELKPSIYPNGSFGATITLGIKPTTLLLEQGGLNLGHLIHCQITENGIQGNGITRQMPPFEPVGGTHPAFFRPGVSFAKNVKHLIHCEIEGEQMRIHALGGTITYRDPRIPSMIGDPDTHWFYETNGDSLGNNLYANVWHLHRIWVNSPDLDAAAGWGLPACGMTCSSAVGMSQVGFESGHHLATVMFAGSEQLDARERNIIHGSFPNDNPKKLSVYLNGEEVWSSGILIDSGEWSLGLDRVCQEDGGCQLHIRYESETTRRFGYHHVTAGMGFGSNLELKSSSARESDVILRAVLEGGK